MWDKPWLLDVQPVELLTNQPSATLGPVEVLPHEDVPATVAFHTLHHGAGLLQILGFTENPRGIRIRYKLAQNADAQSGKTVVLSGATNELFSAGSSELPPGQLVIDTEQFETAHPEAGELDWGFKCFVPPSHLASILFVRWTNGVPQVDPGYSAYFKVGKAGGIDIPFCSLACYRILDTQYWKGLNEDLRPQALAAWNYPESSGVTNAVRWDVNLGLGFTGSRWMAMPPFRGVKVQLPQSLRSGHQRAIRLVDFDPPEGDLGHGQSGVELRIFLEPLKSPPIRTVPNEVDHTNYIAGRGLAGTMEDALRAIKQWPTDP